MSTKNTVSVLKLLVSLSVFAAACASFVQAGRIYWMTPDTPSSVSDLTLTIGLIWLGVTLVFAAVGVPKFGWQGFFVGWITGFALAPVLLLVVSWFVV